MPPRSRRFGGVASFLYGDFPTSADPSSPREQRQKDAGQLDEPFL
jgi:hypothetical protein